MEKSMHRMVLSPSYWPGWIGDNGEVHVRITQEGLYVSSLYSAGYRGEYNYDIGPAFLSWEELDKIRAEL